MHEYMATVKFLSLFSDEFASLIPDQRRFVTELMEKEIISSYSLSIDRRILWITLSAGSRAEAENILKRMPLYRYMHYEINELMFHDSSVGAQVRFSLN